MYGKLVASKESILSYITEYDIFRYYIPNFEYLGKLFTSELRKDSSPTCSIKKYNGVLKYVDFGTQLKGVDCFYYVMLKYNVNYYEALDLITIDFNLPLLLNNPGLTSNNSKAPVTYNFNLDEIADSTPSILKVKIRDFSLDDKKYWYDKYQITMKDLKLFDIYPLEYFVHKGHVIKNKALTYGYYFGLKDGYIEQWKCYCPNHFKFDIKWRTNCSSDILQGYKQLPESGDLLVITKSLKDIVVLYKIGIHAVAPQAEFQLIDEDILNELKQRFKRIVILYDNDSPGIKAARLHSEEYGLPYVILPSKPKDPSDFVEKYGYEKLSSLLDTLLCIK